MYDVMNGLRVEQAQFDWVVIDVSHSLTEALTDDQFAVAVHR